jgi:predicted translin family RNA/ssDNA-binding protein
MSFSTGLLQAVTSSDRIEPIQTDSVDVSQSGLNFDSMVKRSFESISAKDDQFKDMINQLSNAKFTGDPEKLYQLQNALGEYSNYVSLVSTLVRKGVSTIETLEKSQ